MSVHVFSSFTFAYLDRARVLFQSLRRHCPEMVLWAVMVDEAPDGLEFDPEEEDFDHLITTSELYGDETEAWLFGHDIVEACTAVKGRALMSILERDDCDLVLYFDPDIAIFRPLDDLVDVCRKHAVSLTPHQVAPDDGATAIVDNEVSSLNMGVFNLGFLAVTPVPEGFAFAKWWADRLDEYCIDDLPTGLFVDQKWCNLAPCFFDDVHVLRDPSLNVASWNLSQRDVRITGAGEILVNDRPLGFWHFTKLGPIGDTMTQRYAKSNTDIHEVWWWYKAEVDRNKAEGLPKGYWAFSAFEDGTKIPKTLRRLYRNREDVQRVFPAPRTSDSESFRAWAAVEQANG